MKSREIINVSNEKLFSNIAELCEPFKCDHKVVYHSSVPLYLLNKHIFELKMKYSVEFQLINLPFDIIGVNSYNDAFNLENHLKISR